MQIRYSAGAGNASRYIKVNDVYISTNFNLFGTSSWSSWNSAYISIPLAAGQNKVEIGYLSTLGNNNFLNVDVISGL